MHQILLRQDSTTLVLQGPGMAAPFRGARYAPGTGLADEPVELGLEGTPAEIEAALARLAWLMDEAARWYGIPGGQTVYLECTVTEGGPAWRTPLAGGRVELMGIGPDQRLSARQGVRLRLARAGWWEGAEVELPLSNHSASRVTGGVTVSNHWDGQHEAWVDAAAADTAGDLPAPAHLVYTSLDADLTGTLWAGQNVTSDPANLLAQLEAEDGAGLSGVTAAKLVDATASNGVFYRLGWTGEAETGLWRVSLAESQMAMFGGRAFLPLLRLHTMLGAGEQVWSFLRVTASWTGGATEGVMDGAPGYLPTQAYLCPCGPLSLPPWPVMAGEAAGEAPMTIGLELRAAAAGAGSHQLDLDYLFLLPLDGWRVYRPLLKTWGPLLLDDNPALGTVKGQRAAQAHAAEGPGLVVWPGRLNRYYFLAERQGGGGFAPSCRATVKLSYRPRKSVI